MNFLLNHIELHIDDVYVELGERLLQKEALTSLFQSEKNLWLASITDFQVFEVEIQLVANRVKAVTCDCTTFDTHNICAHVVAVLLQLRTEKKLEQEKKATEKITPVPIKSTKITTNTILRNISHEDLTLFVKNYARSNRPFSVALKTKFASKVDVTDSQDKYVQVLHAAISMHRNTKGGFSSKSIRDILKIAKEMIAQSEDAIALRNYSEGFAILEACLLKISPILRHNSSEEENQNFIFKILQTTWSIHAQEIAPLLRVRIWDFLSKEAFKSFYFQENVESYFFDFLLELATDLERIQTLIELVDSILLHKDISISNQVNLISLQLALFGKNGNEAAATALIEANMAEDIVIVMAIKNAVTNKQYNRAKQLAAANPTFKRERKYREQIDELLLQVAVNEKDIPSIERYSEKRFLQTYHFDYFDTFLVHSESDSLSLYNMILPKIKTQAYTTEKRDAIAQLHYREGQIPALFEYFYAIRSLDLLKKYDTLLLKEHQALVYALYEELLVEYINNHIGPKSAKKISLVVHHLRKIGARDLADKLVRIFRQDYGERHTLIEELQFF